MRRLVVVISAVFMSVFLLSSVALSATTTDRQYEPSDGTSGTDFVSQGSVNGDTLEARAAQADLAEEDRLPDYSQVVDNSTKGRFVAPGWRHVSGVDDSYEADYAVAEAGSDAKKATFRVKVPTNNDYGVYAWWTADENNALSARFVIESASGPHTEKVDETKEGGMWIKLGDFEMKEGERTVQVYPSGDADVVADAVAIVRGTGAPPEETTFTTEGDETMRATATRSRVNGRDIVRVAKRYMGTRYKWGTCTRARMSCTCETRKAVKPFGHKLSMAERGQWRYEPSRRIKSKSNLRPGDIVFFREGGGRITHVGVYSGRGNLVHASAYFNKVVESKMKYIRGYTGAIRVNPR